MKAIAILVAASALAVASSVAAQSSGRALIEQKFSEFEAQQNFSATARNYGQLRGGASQSFTFDVRGGAAMFIGLCDENCSDVDLIVRNSAGQVVGSDVLDDNYPVVGVENAPAGRYTVEVQMPGCTSSCHWGVHLYQ